MAKPLAPGIPAPPVPGVDLGDAPLILFFYKITCPVCQMAAPAVEAFERGYPGRITGVGQDPQQQLATFSELYGMSFRSSQDDAPYDASNAYRIRVVPTTFLVGADGRIVDVVESWDRERLNELSREVADLLGSPYTPISEPGDGRPPFRPG